MFRLTAALRSRQILKVERKFAPTPASIDSLTRNAGRPSFRKLEPLTSIKFEDTYYDRDIIFNGKGIYIRRRSQFDSDQWEAKVKVGGDFINSAFQEFTGAEAVSKIIHQHLPKPGSFTSVTDMLEVWARFSTRRRSWKVNDHFLIVLDEADFGHMVGEVELSTSQRRLVAPHELSECRDRFLSRLQKA